jgi:hypothetical protein
MRSVSVKAVTSSAENPLGDEPVAVIDRSPYPIYNRRTCAYCGAPLHGIAVYCGMCGLKNGEDPAKSSKPSSASSDSSGAFAIGFAPVKAIGYGSVSGEVRVDEGGHASVRVHATNSTGHVHILVNRSSLDEICALLVDVRNRADELKHDGKINTGW